jgi:DNA mismatch endonuclease (patch repair protein)
MRSVKSKDTAPELVVRRLVFAMGVRYRLHTRTLAGSPDLVLRRRNRVVFVNGCFWHGHDCRRGSRQPKTNAPYWRAKIDNNRDRDKRNILLLEGDGWKVLTIWECETKDVSTLSMTLRRFLADEESIR